MKDKYIFGTIGIGAVTWLETIAMYNGLNGNFFGLSIAAIGAIIGGVAGYTIKEVKNGYHE